MQLHFKSSLASSNYPGACLLKRVPPTTSLQNPAAVNTDLPTDVTFQVHLHMMHLYCLVIS